MIMDRDEDSPSGFAFAIAAYVMWGLMPLYMKALDHMPPAEVIAHRILWSIPVAGAILLVTRRTADLRAALRSPRMLAMSALTAAIISVNWGIYVWAIGAGRALDTALGYYINPLFSAFLGVVLLGERLSRAQIVALLLAAGAVVVLTVEAGRLPLVALGLTVSWGIYAYCKRALPIGPNQGFLLEVLVLAAPALAYLVFLSRSGGGHFLGAVPLDTWLLLGSGAITAIPLIIYANGAKRLRLSTIGVLQYIAPTMIFLIAVLVFGEPFGTAQMIAFPMIWAALVIYTASMLRQRGRAARSPALRPARP
jgi:chloramphenicol-sensitive protein RarD